ncbi:o-succinylbenzoate--CoA ligase [Aggregatibacter actinomycetemcomitans]|uniref:o-succinylbenzoate--CoA ligase n=1 Tax=Aggregatibacter actinomycetemcomitans TaxID=714 RepID=UPI0011D498D3|nr:o-succinylbenzoate--CoA ligase [Aggregatibacter actinomycetemcomitans]TYA35456.1 o-succinylbenzoate--CoA ligase [Aggregatibacter actinomycetemcomitans]
MALGSKFAQSSLFSERIALQVLQGDAFTWRQLVEKTLQISAYLQQLGVEKQCGVALCGKNSLELLLFYLAAIQTGARVLMLNPMFPLEKRVALCQSNHADFYFTAEQKVFDSEQQKCGQIFKCFLTLNDAMAQANQIHAYSDVDIDFSQPATMTLTSGSTGLPKAVVHNVQAHLDNARGVCELMNFDAADSWLLSLPLYHVSGQGIVWRWLTGGATLVLPGEDFYVAVNQVTHVSLVPTQVQRWLQYLQENPAPLQIKAVLLGGAHIPLTLTRALQQLGIKSYSGYGMTEMASTVFAKESDEKNGVGNVLAGREYCLHNGEMWLRGAGLALGYWQQGRIVSLLNEQGWFATKDKGQWQNGELVISGRIDNMFTSGGENIQPEEIEKVILQSDLVKQVFVLPVADLEFGQRPVAIIEWLEKSKSAVENLREFLQGRLERFKQPVAYYDLPLNLTDGAIKISRKMLADWLAQQ